MTSMLIVTWDRRRAYALQASSGTVSAAWTAEWPEGVTFAQGAGPWLQQEWSRAGLSAQSLWVVLPREDVVLRHLELPQAPDDELPDLVRFQASGRSTVPIDQLNLDFIPLPADARREGRDVLAATIPKTLTEQVRKLARDLDRELAGLSFTSHALGEWGEQLDRLRRSGPSRNGDQATLVVGCEPGRVELSIVTGHELTFAHVAKIPTGDGSEALTTVLSEVSRTLVAGQRLRAGLKVDHGWVIGADTALAAALTERLECSVESIDPIAAHPQASLLRKLSEHPLPVAVLLGVHTPSLTPGINFIKPRQAPPKRDPRKQQYAIAAGIALLIAFLLGGGGLLRLQSLDRQIAKLYSDSIDQEAMVAAGQPVLAASKVVDDWSVRNVSQLQLMTDLEGMMPGGTQRPYLSEYEFGVGTVDTLGKITARGAARQRTDIETAQQELRQQAGFLVFPKEVTASRDPQYPHRYTLDLSIPKQKQKPVPPPANAVQAPAKP